MILIDQPDATASNDGPVCEGGSLQLNSQTMTSGTTLFYEWSGPNSYSSTDQNPLIAPVSTADAGIYAVTITVDGCVSLPATTEVVLIDQPDASASNDGPVCEGGSLQLNSQTMTSGATLSYEWSGPNSFSSTDQNPLIAPASTADVGIYAVTITVDGCVSVPTTTEVVLIDQPDATASNDGPVCEGGSLQLSSQTMTSGTTLSYEWSGPNSFSSTDQNPLIAPVSTADAGHLCRDDNSRWLRLRSRYNGSGFNRPTRCNCLQ